MPADPESFDGARPVRVLLHLLLILALTAPISAQTANREPLPTQVDRLFAPWDKPNSPGCALAILQNGATIYQRGYGTADLEHAAPVSPQTVFQIASTSKQFTAMAIILLAQDGKLSLDDPIRRYLPELPPYGAEITVRQALHHTSGLRNLFPLYMLAGWRWGDLTTRQNELDLAFRQHALNSTPGEEHNYTNTGYFLLAEIVKRVSGQSFRDFTAARIFQPLGMTHTLAYDDTGMIIPNRAMAYNAAPEGYRNNITLFETVGDSNIYTTVEDMARWDENFYQARVGGKEGIAVMERPGTLNSGEVTEYAAGLNVTHHKGLKMIWHSGVSMYRSEYLRFPDHHFSVICLCNSAAIDASDLARRVADLYLGDHEQTAAPTPAPAIDPSAPAKIEQAARAEAVTLSTAELERFTGAYLLRDALTIRRVYLSNGHLLLDRGRGITSEMVPVARDRFVMLGVPQRVEVTFTGEQPRPQTISFLPPRQKPLVADRVNPDPPSDLHAYDGKFWTDDVGEVVTIAAHDGKLWLQTKRNVEFELRPVAADIFTNQWFGKLTFLRDRQNGITALTMSNNEVRNLKMEKMESRVR